MRSLKLNRLIPAVAMALVLATGAAQAQRHPGMGGPGMGPMMGGHVEHMLDMVDATEAQRAQIKSIMDAARNELKTQHETLRSLHEQGLTLFSATNVDAAAIEALRQRGSAAHEQVSKRMSQAMIDVARVLTPEQRSKLAAKLKQRQARMAERMKSRSGQ
ncbi:Spy/CpxP family protein refolding chaperone [Roseateles sp. DB2]|uniref:Spy/CpxP family protein refolding chaperone n=1 Tax=Roseateles sp. DB2 TaxID=3453717 RepID=UPI003EEDE6CC